MPVVFKNEGEIDIRAVTIAGVSVKVTENPFGRFGTGLKFAIAILLRTGHTITVCSGLTTYRFVSKPDTIRGKEFQLVHIEYVDDSGDGHSMPVGFTTDLGKQWELWMAYRELYCNAMDENGDSTWLEEEPAPEEGYTQVIIEGEEFTKIHVERDKFILPLSHLTPMFVVPGEVEVYEGTSFHAYYRGIRVGDIPNGPSRYTYNVLGHLWLTEDRTMGWPDQFVQYMGKAVMGSDSEEFIEDVLLSVDEGGDDRKGAETFINFEGKTLTEKVLKVARKVIETTKGRCNKTIYAGYREYERENLLLARLDLNQAQAVILVEAVTDVGRTGLTVRDYQLGVVADVGADRVSYRKDKTLLLHIDLLDNPEKLRATIFRELVSANGHDLATEEGQTWLINRYIHACAEAVSYGPVTNRASSPGETTQPAIDEDQAAAHDAECGPEKNWLLIGEWSGYRSGQERIVYREKVTEDRANKMMGVTISYTDNTTLTLGARKLADGEDAKELLGYRDLVRKAEDSGERYYQVK